ncbi:MAG: glycosyltransferase family 4 protein [Saprospiraceae bacterium]|nr:glycosyltransferase family 4 protein [Saprospiraceae bacterium]
MCRIIAPYRPICVFSRWQNLDNGLEQHTFRTYTNILTFIIQSLMAFIRVPIFLIKQKRKHGELTVYCTVFHPWNLLFVLWANILKCRTIVTVHDFKTHAGERSRLIEAIQRVQMRLANKVVFLTNFVRRQALDWNESIRGKSILIAHPIYSGISINTLGHSRALRILALGRMHTYKGMELLLEATEDLDMDCLTIAGLGASRHAPLKGNIRIIDDWLSNDRIQELLLEHHVMVLPYLEASQSGVLALGIAAGMPMVVTRVGGLTEQVTPDAVLFSNPTTSDLKLQISRIRDDANIFNTLKSNIAGLRHDTDERIRLQVAELFQREQ